LDAASGFPPFNEFPMRLQRDRRRGQALVEFAVIALILYLLLAATLELGRATFGVQTIQASADLAAREISRTPLSVTYASLNGTGASDPTAALNDAVVRQRIFDERLLVIDLDNYPADTDLGQVFATFPVVNQQLRTVMIFDQSAGRRLLRYPGALIKPSDESAVTAPLPAGFTDTGFRVAVPLIVSRGTDGVETIKWVRVLEEIDPGDATASPPRPAAFSVTSPSGGVVGVRINYPFQAASLSAYPPSPRGPFEPNGNQLIKANDGGVTQDNAIPGGGTLADLTQDVDPHRQLQPNGGAFGLGTQQARGQALRPFRRLVTGQAIYRREVLVP
jgi:hypothetical protein